MILLIDNYDSFVHNLARYLARLGQETAVVRNDVINASEIHSLNPQAIVLSPGPCTPSEAGSSLSIVREFVDKLPMLGICLGHQTIAMAMGTNVVRAEEPMHGRTSEVNHLGTPLFSQIPSPFTACRYHSLVVDPDTLNSDIRATAWSVDGTIMAIEHVKHPVFGVQFHPEAVLTQHGFRLLANFLQIAGLPSEEMGDQLSSSEWAGTQRDLPALPQQPITF